MSTSTNGAVLERLWAGARREAPGAEPASLRRRLLRWGVVAAVVLIVGGLLVWSRPTGLSEAAYHPENPGVNGARALARVLAERGVEVLVVEGERALRTTRIDQNTTVVVTNTADLRDVTTRGLEQLARPAERLVLVRPDRAVVRTIAPEVSMRVQGRSLIDSGCSGGDARAGERLSRSLDEYRRDGSLACFVTDGYGVYLRTSTPRVRELVLIGSTDVVTNDRIHEVANGAVALRTLGHSPRLVWYVPDLRDVPVTSMRSSERLYPPWWSAAVMLAVLTVVALIWWRGRRFGRLVVEPLPVVIRATETTESRGRMYHRARDSGRASSVLREATRRRLTAYLGLPGVDGPALVAAVARATGRPVEQVQWALAGPPADTENVMLELAGLLAAIEKEIRR